MTDWAAEIAKPSEIDWAAEVDKTPIEHPLLIAAARGLRDVQQGAEQIQMRMSGVPSSITSEYDRQVAAEEDAYQSGGVTDYPGTTLSRIGGNVVGSWLPGGAATKGAMVAMDAGRVLPLTKAAAEQAGQWLTKRAVVGGAAGGGTVGALQPTTGDFATEKAGQVAVGVGAGAGTAFGLNRLGALAENVHPVNAMKTLYSKLLERMQSTPFAEEGKKLVARTGIEMSPGAETGSKPITMAENASRQSFFTAQGAFDADAKVANQAVTYINKVMDLIKSAPTSAESVGREVQAATKRAVETIIKKRDALAAREYGKIREVAGDSQTFLTNAMKEAKAIADEYSGVASSEAKRIAAQANALLEDLSKPFGIKDAMKTRSYYSAASKGVGNIFEDVSKPVDQQIAARLTRAIGQDFEDMANNATGDVGPLLRQANANYSKHMQAVDFIEKSILGRVVGDDVAGGILGGQMNTVAPEKVASMILKAHPSEIEAIVPILREHAPDTLASVKRYVIENALETAKAAPPSAGAKTLALDPNKFVKSLAAQNPKFASLYSKAEIGQIDDAINAMRRFGDKFGTNYSGTGPMNEMLTTFQGLATFSARSLATVSGKFVGLKHIVAMMDDPANRAAALQLSRLPPGAAEARQPLDRLTAAFLAETTRRSPSEQPMPAGPTAMRSGGEARAVGEIGNVRNK